ncbi:MAG: ABC transporter permease subunit, partial [Candidatus Saccharibacteria bacterium]|nr:ABC transporter permease subunit [Pseudorhodobacter sp.]
LPYTYLTLSGPFRAWDTRIAKVAATLGASEVRIFWRLRLPLLLTPVLTAAAIGAAVSIAQYLPTLLVGGGRVTTLTTEALALASGGNRRLTAAYAVLQTLLPIAGFVIATQLPGWLNTRRFPKGAA